MHWIIMYMGAVLGCYTPKPTNIAELKTALLSIWNGLPREFTDKAILSFRKILRFCVAAAGKTLWSWTADIHYWNVWSVDEMCKVWFVIKKHSL